MDSGYITLGAGLVTLGWFGIKMYIKNQRLESEIDRHKEKISELKEWIRDSK